MGIKACKDCNKRAVGCHSTCEDYKKERAELDKRNEKISKGRFVQNELADREIMAYQRNRKR